MCCIWYDNGKHGETSIYSLRIRSCLISNEGFVLAKKLPWQAFSSRNQYFFPLFLFESNFICLLSPFYFFFLILLRQQWPDLHTLWIHALIRKSSCYPCEMAELGREGVNLRGSIWALSKKRVLVQHCDTACHTLTHSRKIGSARKILGCGQTLKLIEPNVEWRGQLQGNSLNLEQVGFCWHAKL